MFTMNLSNIHNKEHNFVGREQGRELGSTFGIITDLFNIAFSLEYVNEV